jgi:PIF1-like helicase
LTPHGARADLIQHTWLIVWDEFPMANKTAIECADEFCHTIMRLNEPFGGIPFLALSDFRQNAPVTTGHCGITAVLSSSIKSSHLWHKFQVSSLHRLIRGAQDLDYVHFVDHVGENYENEEIVLDILERVYTTDNAIDFLFPSNTLQNPQSCLRRAFLSSLNRFIDEFNKSVLDRLDGREGDETKSK